MDIPRIGVAPKIGPHASADGENPYGLPEHTSSVCDPLETLTWVAADTQHIRLGTSVLDSLFHPPVVLARRLATLDRLSVGRIIAGIGQGWMPEGFTAAGVPITRRGAALDGGTAVAVLDGVRHREACFPEGVLTTAF